MRIVVGWNGSEQGEDALRLAADLARLTSGLVTVACVIEPGVVPPELVRDREAWVERFQSLFAAARRELGDIEFSVREAIEDVAGGLREIALEEAADLLVLGSTHRGAIGQLFPGTVAERLLSHPPCALAIAPRGYADRPHAGIGVIGVGYDGSRSGQAALEMATELVQAAGDELRIVGIAPDYAGIELPPPLELRNETTRSVERALDAVSDEVAACAVVAVGDPAAHLEAEGVAVDMLVIGSRGRGPIKNLLLGSVSADVMRRAPCPVLVVPEPGV